MGQRLPDFIQGPFLREFSFFLDLPKGLLVKILLENLLLGL